MTESSVAAHRPAYGWLVQAAVVAFAIVLIGAVARGLWSAAADHEPATAPVQLAGYQLLSVMTGDEALGEITKFHGKEISVVEAWIGHYQEDGAVWVARAASVDEAAQFVAAMARGIQKGGTPFSGLSSRDLQGMTIYGVTDGRQPHYFYQMDDRVVWVTAPAGAGTEFLTAALEAVM